MTHHQILSAAVLAGLVAFTPVSLAGQEIMTDAGYTTLHTVSEDVTQRADGGMLVRTVGTGVVISDDKESPLHHLASDCMFNTAIAPDGTVESSIGFCAQHDADGNMYGAWGHADADGGEWRMIPGSGAFANVGGGGAYWTQTQWEDGRAIIRWTAEWSMN